MVPRALLSDPGSVLPLSPGAESAAGRAAQRGAAVGTLRLLRRGGVGVPDAAACDPLRPRLCPRQRQPLALAVVSVGAVRIARACRPGASVPAVLVDALDRRQRQRTLDLRPILPRSIRTGNSSSRTGERA